MNMYEFMVKKPFLTFFIVLLFCDMIAKCVKYISKSTIPDKPMISFSLKSKDKEE